MDSSDIIEVLVTLGVVFFSVIGSLIKERSKRPKNTHAVSSASGPRQEPHARQRRQVYSAPDDWIERSQPVASDDMPGDYYSNRPAMGGGTPQSLTEVPELPVEPMELPGAPEADPSAPVVDTPERRRLIDNLIMGEILARKF